MHQDNKESKRRCLWCGQDLNNQESLLSIFYYDDVLCEKCRYEMKYKIRKINKNKMIINYLYPYKGIGREMLIQYKELYDEALATSFLYPYKKIIEKKYRGCVFVSIPSSKEKTNQRGFKHVEKIFEGINIPIIELLEKNSDIEMKHLNKNERYLASRLMKLKDEVIVPKEKIILIDDVVTTGYSLFRAKECLGKEVEALCIFGSDSFDKNKKRMMNEKSCFVKEMIYNEIIRRFRIGKV